MGETRFLYAVICTLAQITAHIVMGFCLELLLTEPEGRQFQRKRVMIWILTGSGSISAKCLLPLPFAFMSAVTPIVMSLFAFSFLKVFYKNKWAIKLFHIAMLVILNLMTDIIYQSVLGYQIGNKAHNLPLWTRVYADCCVICAAISVVLHSIYTIIVLKTWNRKRVRTNLMWMAGLVSLGLLPFFVFVIRGMAGGGAVYFMFSCILLIMVSVVVMLFLSRSEKKTAQKEQQRMMEEVKELQYAMELEKVRYEQIEARREEMAKLRHDYNNVITSVMYLIENGKTDEARAIMKDLSERISKAGE